MLDAISNPDHCEHQPTCSGHRPATVVVIPVTKSTPPAKELIRSCIASIKKSLEALNREHEIILVSTANDSVTADEQRTFDASEILRGSLATALNRFATSDSVQVAIVDPEIRFNETQWEWLAESQNKTDLACYFQTNPASGNWKTRLAQALVSFVTRLALGTGKNNGRPGVIIFDSARLRPLLNEGVKFESAAELIALCREDGYSIFEAQLTSPHFEMMQPESLKTQARRISRTAQFWWNNLAFPTNNDDSQPPQRQKLSAKTRWLGIAVLGSIAAAILFSNLNYPFLEPDETRNAQLGLNIYQSGDWLSLTLSQENYWDKPPLQAWMTAASYHLFGPGEFATRLPCAVATLLTLLTVLVLGSKVFDERTGFLGAVLLLLSGGFLLSGRYVTMDASLTCFSTIMLLALVLGFRAGQNSRLWLTLAGIACGLGILTKGPVIGVLVLPPVLLAGWLEQNLALRQLKSWLFVAVPAFLISAPWFLATVWVHPDFLYYFFWKHNVARFSNAFNHQQPWWFYLPVLMLMMYPACFLIPFFIKTVISTSRSKKHQLGGQFGQLLLYVMWVIGFFSLSESKLPTYIIPALPIFCLLLGRTLLLTAITDSAILTTGNWLNSIPRHMSMSVGTMLIIAAVALLFVFPSPLNSTVAFAVIGLLSVLTFVFVRRIRSLDNVRIGLTAVAIAGLLFVSLLVTQLLPKIAESRSVQTAISQLAESPEYHESPIVFMGRPPFGNAFWLPDRKIFHFADDHEMDAAIFLMNQPNAILIASKSDITALRRNLIGAEFQKGKLHRKLYTMRPKMASAAPSLDARQQLPVRISRLPFSGR